MTEEKKKEEAPAPPARMWSCRVCEDGCSCDYLGPKPPEKCEEHPERTPKWKAVR